MLRTHSHDIKHDRVNQSSHTHTDGPPSDPESIALSSQITREDLGGDQESNCTPGSGISIVHVNKVRTNARGKPYPKLNKKSIVTAPGAY
jgi:hypothetical protein